MFTYSSLLIHFYYYLMSLFNLHFQVFFLTGKFSPTKSLNGFSRLFFSYSNYLEYWISIFVTHYLLSSSPSLSHTSFLIQSTRTSPTRLHHLCHFLHSLLLFTASQVTSHFSRSFYISLTTLGPFSDVISCFTNVLFYLTSLKSWNVMLKLPSFAVGNSFHKYVLLSQEFFSLFIFSC